MRMPAYEVIILANALNHISIVTRCICTTLLNYSNHTKTLSCSKFLLANINAKIFAEPAFIPQVLSMDQPNQVVLVFILCLTSHNG